MARPSVAHGGFLIPNAGSVSDPILAEPDRVDFNTLANARWGVLSGCLVAGSGVSTVSVQAGTAMVNGKFVLVSEKTDMQIQIPSGAAKFDLVVTDDNGVPYILSGKESADPVYPDPPVNTTVLAAIYTKTGLDITDYVIDKRKFLSPALLTKIPGSDDLIRNYNSPPVRPGDPPLNSYQVLGDGTTVWMNDLRAFRSAPGTLRIEDRLEVEVSLSAATITGTDVIMTGNVTGKNLRRQAGAPSAPSRSDFWQDPSTGKVYIANDQIDGTIGWDEIQTTGHLFPVGSIITSLEAPSKMAALGWLLMDGKTLVSEVSYPNLFKIDKLSSRFSGVAPNRTMYLPDLTKRFLMADPDNVGKLGPVVAGTPRAKNEIKLTNVNQLPPHIHGTTTRGIGGFTPQATIQATTGHHSNTVSPDTHGHDISDPGHKHVATVVYVAGAYDTPQGRPGEQRVLAPFVTGGPRETAAVGSALTYVSVQLDTHSHTTGGGQHGHPVDMNPIGGHAHDLDPTPVGTSAAIDITPNYFACYVYIRS